MSTCSLLQFGTHRSYKLVSFSSAARLFSGCSKGQLLSKKQGARTQGDKPVSRAGPHQPGPTPPQRGSRAGQGSSPVQPRPWITSQVHGDKAAPRSSLGSQSTAQDQAQQKYPAPDTALGWPGRATVMRQIKYRSRT